MVKKILTIIAFLFLFVSSNEIKEKSVLNNLKIKVNNLKVVSLQKNKIIEDRTFECYFFFTEQGIITADNNGIMRYVINGKITIIQINENIFKKSYNVSIIGLDDQTKYLLTIKESQNNEYFEIQMMEKNIKYVFTGNLIK
jgi:hypothetical protein